MDIYLNFLNKKPFLVRLQSKLTNAVDVLESFTNMHLHFSTQNYQMLISSMNEKDIELFQFDTRSLNWKLYIENYFVGIKKFLIKEDSAKMNLNIKIYKR
jgi:fatty acyl-CoA reductase